MIVSFFAHPSLLPLSLPNKNNNSIWPLIATSSLRFWFRWYEVIIFIRESNIIISYHSSTHPFLPCVATFCTLSLKTESITFSDFVLQDKSCRVLQVVVEIRLNLRHHLSQSRYKHTQDQKGKLRQIHRCPRRLRHLLSWCPQLNSHCKKPWIVVFASQKRLSKFWSVYWWYHPSHWGFRGCT